MFRGEPWFMVDSCEGRNPGEMPVLRNSLGAGAMPGVRRHVRGLRYQWLGDPQAGTPVVPAATPAFAQLQRYSLLRPEQGVGDDGHVRHLSHGDLVHQLELGQAGAAGQQLHAVLS